MTPRIQRLHRRAQIVELLLLKATADEIAELLDMPRATALREIALVEKLEDQATRQMVARYRQIQHERIEDVIYAVWPHAVGGEGGSPDYKAVRELRGLLARQSRLLGLDAPERREVELSGQVDLGLQQLPPEQRAVLRAQLLRVAEGEEALVVDAEPLQLGPGD